MKPRYFFTSLTRISGLPEDAVHRRSAPPAEVGDGGLRRGRGRLPAERALAHRAPDRPDGRGRRRGSRRRGLRRPLRDPRSGRRLAEHRPRPPDGGAHRRRSLRHVHVEVSPAAPAPLDNLQGTRNVRTKQGDDARLRPGGPGARFCASDRLDGGDLHVGGEDDHGAGRGTPARGSGPLGGRGEADRGGALPRHPLHARRRRGCHIRLR